MYEGYFDESGDLDSPPKIFCVSGYVLESENARQMDVEWRSVLSKYAVPYFHMVECAHGNRVFAGKPRNERIALVAELIGLIKKFTLKGFSIIGHGDYFLPMNQQSEDLYTHSATLMARLLRGALDWVKDGSDIVYVFESGHASQGRAYKLLMEKIANTSDSVTFADKRKIALLQAADLLAWQSTKYAKDSYSEVREPRKDFLSLMEHPHDFFMIDVKDGKPLVVLQHWPASRRTEAGFRLTWDNSGPISICREEGDDTPIIVVAEANGWRESSFGSALVRFEDRSGNRFALAIDRVKLQESIHTLVSATSLYPDSNVRIKPKSMCRERLGSGFVLRVDLQTGAVLRFDVSEKDLNSFRMMISDPSSE